MSSVQVIFDETITTDHKVITEELSKSILKNYGVKVPPSSFPPPETITTL